MQMALPKPIQAAVVQADIAWAAPEANRKHLEEMIASNPGADLYVLPEMFSTGFATSPEGVAEESPARSLEWMKRLSREGGYAVCGSIALHEGGRYYNRLYFVTPEGPVYQYDKYHLFTYSSENEWFTPGSERSVIEWRGVKFLLTVCYDLRFPVWMRSRDDYDVIINVASWPVVRRLSWDTLTLARAIENQAFMICCNRVGNDPVCEYSGGSAVYDPMGTCIGRVPDSEEGVAVCKLNMLLARGYRDKFPILKDADNFTLESR